MDRNLKDLELLRLGSPSLYELAMKLNAFNLEKVRLTFSSFFIGPDENIQKPLFLP